MSISAGLPVAVRSHAHQLFDGVLARDDLPWAGRLILRLLGGRYGDFRDCDKITSWADRIAAELTAARRPTNRSTKD